MECVCDGAGLKHLKGDGHMKPTNLHADNMTIITTIVGAKTMTTATSASNKFILNSLSFVGVCPSLPTPRSEHVARGAGFVIG
jgi:hypothetical protein